jgi:hypothetical protein
VRSVVSEDGGQVCSPRWSSMDEAHFDEDEALGSDAVLSPASFAHLELFPVE